jgi:hypothetical protein
MVSGANSFKLHKDGTENSTRVMYPSGSGTNSNGNSRGNLESAAPPGVGRSPLAAAPGVTNFLPTVSDKVRGVASKARPSMLHKLWQEWPAVYCAARCGPQPAAAVPATTKTPLTVCDKVKVTTARCMLRSYCLPRNLTGLLRMPCHQHGLQRPAIAPGMTD